MRSRFRLLCVDDLWIQTITSFLFFFLYSMIWFGLVPGEKTFFLQANQEDMIPNKLWSNVTNVLSDHDCPCYEDLFSLRFFTVALRPAARCTKSRRVRTEWQKGSLWCRAVVVKVSGDYDRCTYVVAVVLSLGRWNWFTGPGVQLNRRPMKTLGNRSWRELQTRHAEECQDVYNYRVVL